MMSEMNMRGAFEREMQRLLDSGQEFARAHPEQARMLNLEEVHDRDPYVERLLEGVAYLTAGVRREIDQSLTDLNAQVLDCIAPELAEPYPSATILEYRTDPAQLGTVELPLGTTAHSIPVGDNAVRVPYATSIPIVARPLSVARTRWESLHTGGSTLEISFQHAVDAFPEGHLPGIVELFIDAEPALAFQLRDALLRGAGDIAIRLPGDEQWRSVGMVGHITPLSLAGRGEQGGAAIPGSTALEQLQHFFLARELLQFVVLRGLDGVEPPPGGDGFDIRIQLRGDAPPAADGRNGLLRCNCVPARNLLRGEADPVRVDRRVNEYPVHSNVDGLHTRIVHQVLEALGRSRDDGETKPYAPVWNWELADQSRRIFRVIRRDTGVGNNELTVLLEDQDAQRRETVSLDILYSHGALPRLHLGRGDINRPSGALPEGVSVTNLRRPTPFWSAPGGAREMRALTLLARADLERLANAETLRGLLRALDRHDSEESRARIEAIRHVGWEPTARLKRGILEQGVAVHLALDGRRMLNRGEACLLGELLHGLFQAWAPIDRYVELRMSLEPLGEEERWTTL